MVHVLRRQQLLKCDVQTAWSFFSRPENLQKITPADIGFEVLSTLPEDIYAGLMIRYKISVIKGLPMHWLTEITHVSCPNYFVDEQVQGPYALWHHEHHFEAQEGGTLMTDIVHYSLPFGWFGDLFHNGLVKKKLEHIFDYRQQILNTKFG